MGAALVAGCTGASEVNLPTGNADEDGDTGDTGDGTDNQEAGMFRLLISDQPNAINDFAELNVTFSTARVFRAEGRGDDRDDMDDSPDDADDEGDTVEEADDVPSDDVGDEDDTVEGDDVADSTSVEDTGDTTDDDDVDDLHGDDSNGNDVGDDDEGSNSQQGWVEIDLEGETVDLTEVIGERAVAVAETPLAAGRYSSIELSVESVEGIAANADEQEASDGEMMSDETDQNSESQPDTPEDEDEPDTDEDGSEEELIVHVPSDRLRLVRPFDVVTDEKLSFVFDINVVRRGQTGTYNLLPVIGKSGVVGKDVNAEEIERDDEVDDSTEEFDNEVEGSENESDDRGRPDERPDTGQPDDVPRNN